MAACGHFVLVRLRSPTFGYRPALAIPLAQFDDRIPVLIVYASLFPERGERNFHNRENNSVPGLTALFFPTAPLTRHSRRESGTLYTRNKRVAARSTVHEIYSGVFVDRASRSANRNEEAPIAPARRWP